MTEKDAHKGYPAVGASCRYYASRHAFEFKKERGLSSRLAGGAFHSSGYRLDKFRPFIGDRFHPIRWKRTETGQGPPPERAKAKGFSDACLTQPGASSISSEIARPKVP